MSIKRIGAYFLADNAELQHSISAWTNAPTNTRKAWIASEVTKTPVTFLDFLIEADQLGACWDDIEKHANELGLGLHIPDWRDHIKALRKT